MAERENLTLINVHCEGEIGKVIIAGAPDIAGTSVAEKLDHLNRHDHPLRRFALLEPRGSAAGSVNLLVPPAHPEADAGFLILQPDQAHAMSGSNAICVTTALLETGMLAMRAPETPVRLDTAAGLVRATAACRDGRCERVRLDMVPAFVEALDVTLDTDRWGKVTLDICFGGVFYALIDAAMVGLSITPANAGALAAAGMELKRLINARLPVRHPEIPAISGIAYVMFRDREPDGAIRTCTTMWPGRVDRSPCGTGSSAQLAALHARGQARIGDTLKTRSIINSTFDVTLAGATRIAGRAAILAQISGRAWIYGRQECYHNRDDPFTDGFALTDTWGPFAGDIGP